MQAHPHLVILGGALIGLWSFVLGLSIGVTHPHWQKRKTRPRPPQPPPPTAIEIAPGYKICQQCFIPLESKDTLRWGGATVCKDRPGCRGRRKKNVQFYQERSARLWPEDSHERNTAPSPKPE